MIHIPEQPENPEQHELPPHPKSEPTINSASGKKAWNELQEQLAKEAEIAYGHKIAV